MLTLHHKVKNAQTSRRRRQANHGAAAACYHCRRETQRNVIEGQPATSDVRLTVIDLLHGRQYDQQEPRGVSDAVAITQATTVPAPVTAAQAMQPAMTSHVRAITATKKKRGNTTAKKSPDKASTLPVFAGRQILCVLAFPPLS